MDTPGEFLADPSFDRYARMVRRSLGTPMALVCLVVDDHQVVAGASGLPPEVDTTRPLPLSDCLGRWVVADRQPLVVTDAREDDRLRGNPAVAALGVAAYAGWPLTDHTGEVVGALCAVDVEPRPWTIGDVEMLQDVAAACSTQISERATRAIEADLAHRSRVLLALSEGLSAARTLAEVAAAVEQTAVDQLGCLRAGLWLRSSQQNVAWSEGVDRLVYVDYPGGQWLSARRNNDLPLDESNPLGRAVLEGQPQYFPDRTSQNDLYPELDISTQVGEARSFIPLVTRRRALGTLALVWEEARAVSDADQRTIEALTSYTTQAVQRTALLQERLQALVTLQASLLPKLPEPESLELAAHYRPASSHDQVGGDWYDAVVMPSGATSLMIGDVVGHNISAAAIMGQLRNMLRSIAWAVDDVPSRNVTRLDHAMADLAVDGMASLVYARIEQSAEQQSRGERTLRWTNAGHPAPVLVGPDGSARLLEHGPGDLMVGVLPDVERSDNRTTIEPESVLLLYTDGLVERRGEDITLGLERLCKAAEANHGLPVAEFLDAVLAELVPERLDDDVAVLAVRCHGQGGAPAAR